MSRSTVGNYLKVLESTRVAQDVDRPYRRMEKGLRLDFLGLDDLARRFSERG